MERNLVVIKIVSADEIPAMDINGKADPFVNLKFGVKKFQTPVIKKTLHPTWNFMLMFVAEQHETAYNIDLELWDWDRAKTNDLIGTASIPLSEFPLYTSETLSQLTPTYSPYLSITTNTTSTFPLNPSKEVIKKKKSPVINLEVIRLDRSAVISLFWRGLVEWFADDAFNRTIKFPEFLSILHSIDAPICQSLDDVENLYKSIDENGDGMLQIDEITDFFIHKTKPNSPSVQSLLPNELFVITVIKAALKRNVSVGTIVMNPISLQKGNKQSKKNNANQSNVNLIDKLNDEDEKSEHYSEVKSAAEAKLMVFNRETHSPEVEKIPNYLRISLKLMYGVGNSVTNSKKIQSVLATMTFKQGKSYGSPSSKSQIKPFIQFHHLNMDESLISDPDQFETFNDFFYRKLKPEARPIAGKGDPKIISSPADSRMLVFPSVEKSKSIWIKAQEFTIESLFLNNLVDKTREVFTVGNNDDACQLIDYFGDQSAIAICRLAPQDYHRFHMPVDGKFIKMVEIPGSYFTVNPLAIHSPVNVYAENHRLIGIIETTYVSKSGDVKSGYIGYIPVGATMVGSIIMTCEVNQPLQKGDEVGYFAFGGSTILLIFPPDLIAFDDDILIYSAKPIETLVKMGDKIGAFN